MQAKEHWKEWNTVRLHGEKPPRQADEKPPKRKPQKRAKPSQKGHKKTAHKTPQTRRCILSYCVRCVGSCDQPSGAQHYVIPVTFRIQAGQTSSKNHQQRPQKPPNKKKQKPKEKDPKQRQTKATKTGKTGKKRPKKTPRTKPKTELDRIASSKLRNQIRPAESYSGHNVRSTE